MNSYYAHVVPQKRKDYVNLVLPLLVKSGYNGLHMLDLFNKGQVRMRWGTDYKEFTVHMTNPRKEPTWPMDDQIHTIWKGLPVENRLVMTCFIKSEGIGPVSSVAMTDLYTLASGLKLYGIKQKVKNRFNNQTFMTLSFSHQSLAKSIRRIK